MVKKRPHSLSFQRIPNGSRDVNGDWIVPENEEQPKLIKCKAVANGNGRAINTQDGISVVYSWTIYLDKNVEVFNYGDSVKLLNDKSEVLGEGTVKMFQRSQFNSKIWV